MRKDYLRTPQENADRSDNNLYDNCLENLTCLIEIAVADGKHECMVLCNERERPIYEYILQQNKYKYSYDNGSDLDPDCFVVEW
jgi:hypothetical protein